jgi:tetratricopeptide (TPR) repeat protein
LSPHDAIIRFNLGAAYERKKLYSDAISEYEVALKINSDDTDAQERLADLNFREKKYDQAIKYYGLLAKKYPRRSSIYANLGFAYGELKNYASSAENYEKAIKSDATSSNLHYNLAYTYGKLGREKDAIAEYEKTSPLTKGIVSIIAQYYLKNKNSNQAIKYYKKIVALEPKKAASYSSLGYAYAAYNEWDKAIDNYLTALKYDREDDELYANLGEAYEKKGLYQEALKAYTNAYEINPDSARAVKRIPQIKIMLLQKKQK